jgi:hypothetical protein
MKIVFFHRPKPRQFNYIPRYYDPVKEDMERRKRELGLLSEGDLKERMRAEIRRKWKQGNTGSLHASIMIRTIFYILISILAIYFIFFTDFINKMVSFFVQ